MAAVSSAVTGSALLVGANRGLGLGLTQTLLEDGWAVTATARDPDKAAALQALAKTYPALRILRADIAEPPQVDALHADTASHGFDLIFIIAGISQSKAEPAHEVSPDSAAREFLTNAYWPVAFAERFLDRLAPGGIIAFMSSILGSVSANTSGGAEIYRASKAALNTLGRSFAYRHPGIATLLVHPGWVRTDMGGSRAPLDVPTSTQGMARVIQSWRGRAGHAFLNYKGETLPW